jgi:predicted ATP-binding protein involved in virulence
MNKQLILETVRSWADKRFAGAGVQREVFEQNTPPPFVDIRAGLPDAPLDISGVFFGFQAGPENSLQIWISSDGLGNAYAFMNDDDGEVSPQSFSMPDAPAELTAKLSQIADRFMRTLIFEPALDEWVRDNGGVYEFEQLSEFCGDAAHYAVSHQEWTFFRYKWPSSEDIEIIAGFDGSGNAATFSQSNDDSSSGFFGFDDRISGLQTADQFRAWLDKAVGRPTTMTIREVTIKNLFGNLSYKIPLKTESSATIIHAPNGYGKTTIFNLVFSLLKGKFGDLFKVRFDVLCLEFDGGRRLVVKQLRREVDQEVAEAEERRRRRSSNKNDASPRIEGSQSPIKSISLQLIEKDGRILNQDEITIDRRAVNRRDEKDEVFRILRRSPHLQPDRHGIIDSNTGELLTSDEVLERYSSIGAGEVKEWLSKLLARNEVNLIQTKRLDSKYLLDRDSLQETFRALPRDSRTISATVRHAREVASKLEVKIREHSNISQKLDGDFLIRLIDAEKSELRSYEDLQNDLSEVALKYEKVAEAGILNKNLSSKMPTLPEHAANDSTKNKALELYVENQRQKLQVFDDILAKIQTLKSLVNDRFQMKRLEVSPEEGYYIRSNYDDSLIPLDSLSSGEQHQLVLFHSLIFGMRPGALIMIDEPEISLHVAWQQVFLRDIERIAKNTGAHFLIATHSPQIIDDNWDLTVGLAEQISDFGKSDEKESAE